MRAPGCTPGFAKTPCLEKSDISGNGVRHTEPFSRTAYRNDAQEVQAMNDVAHKVRSLFQAAVENHPPDHWDAYLDEACGEGPVLRHCVQLLLRAHAGSSTLLALPANACSCSSTSARQFSTPTKRGSFTVT